MKKIKLFFIAFLGIVGIVAIQSCQSTKNSTAAKLLKFNFEKGKGYDYEMTMSMDQDIKGQNIQMDMTTYYSMDVTGEEGGNRDITTQIDRFRMKIGAMGMNLDIDTDKPLPDLGETEEGKNPMKMINSLFGAIKGQRFTMKVNPEGKVLEVSGFEDIGKKIIDSIGIELDENERQQMMQQFTKQFNSEKIKSSFERSWYIFPNKEVKVGDTWQKNFSSSDDDLGGGDYSSTYKVTDIEGDMVTLDVKTNIESKKATIDMTGEMKGTMVIDSRSGLIVNADQDMKMKGKGEDDLEMKMKIKIKGKAR